MALQQRTMSEEVSAEIPSLEVSRALDFTARHYAEKLREASGATALAYLRSRGITDKTISAFRIGAAPEPSELGWRDLLDALLANGFTRELGEHAGILVRPRPNSDPRRFRDRFPGFVILPELSESGEPISIIGRILPSFATKRSPKYLERPKAFSQDSASVFLYGLNEVRGARRIILVEGPFDVLACHSMGLRAPAVAQLGKSLALSAARKLVEISDELYLAYDGDESGRKAVGRTLGTLLLAGYDVNAIRVAALPDGEDPAKLGAAKMREILGEARPALEVAQPVTPASNQSGPALVSGVVDDAKIVERARRYLARMDPSISGNGGHDRCYAAATVLIHGFCLDRAVALEILVSDFNPRCEPPWSETELIHKLDDAQQCNHAKPRGYLLADRTASSSIELERNAEEFTPVRTPEVSTDLAQRPIDEDWPVQILGYEADLVVLYQKARHQILRYAPNEFTDRVLVALLGKEWLSSHFPAESGRKAFAGIDVLDAFTGIADKRGRFTPGRVRGRGAWLDQDRPVFNLGDDVIDRGGRFDESRSEFVYQGGERFSFQSDAPALTDSEGRDLVEIAEGFSWVDPASAMLLAGWVALAPLSGVLDWRPHCWLTGGAGTGKTTIQTNYVEKLLKDCGSTLLYGTSTESGIRQTLKGDAVPVLLDETESKTELDATRLETVVGMIRRASSKTSGRETRGTPKGGAISYTVNSMFCLSSITINIVNTEDHDRISILALKPREGEDAGQVWEELEKRLLSLPENISSRLYRRIMDHAETYLSNIATFRSAATAHFRRARTGDQIGTLIAGAHFLMSTRRVSFDEAAAIVAKLANDDMASNVEGDADHVLSAFLGATVQLSSGERRVIATVALAALETVPAGFKATMIEREEARETLLRYGIRVGENDDGKPCILVANRSTALSALFRGTPYATDLRGQLLRLRSMGIGTLRNPKRFGKKMSRVVAIPVDLAVEFLSDLEAS